MPLSSLEYQRHILDESDYPRAEIHGICRFLRTDTGQESLTQNQTRPLFLVDYNSGIT